MTLNERQLLTLGALLHDAGKLGQRASMHSGQPSRSASLEGQVCPQYNSRYTHQHVLWSADAADVFADALQLDSKQRTVFNRATFYHHKPDGDLAKLVQQADWWASGERSQEERDTTEDARFHQKPMACPLERLQDQTPTSDNLTYYVFKPISAELEEQFPVSNKDAMATARNQIEMWDGLLAGLKQLGSCASPEDIEHRLLSLMLRYLWCVPSDTRVLEDVSTFDHCRVTAALATAMHAWCEEKGKALAEADNAQFKLVVGDLSGIQSFIYQIAQATGKGGVAKRLRGRSFYLSLLPQVLALNIVYKLGLSASNVLYCGGGGFSLLVQATADADSKLGELRKDINDWLLREFGGTLALVVGISDELAGDTLAREFLERLGDVQTEKLDKAKLHKFDTHWGPGLFVPSVDDPKQPTKFCPICGLGAILDKDETECEFCQKSKDYGEAVARAKYLAIGAKDSQARGDSLDFGGFGKAYLDDKPIEGQGLWQSIKLNEPESEQGFKFLCNLVPRAIKPFPKAKQDQEGTDDTEYHPGNPVEFHDLAKQAEGDPKLGFLAMDVDKLGYRLFIEPINLADRLKEEYKLELEANRSLSLSRFATVSRMLEQFFAGYTRTIASKLFEAALESRPDDEKLGKMDGLVYSVYTGGDDVLLVGPWDVMAEYAARLAADFGRLSGSNEQLTISAGLFTGQPSYPIAMAADKAEDDLREAKKVGAGISAFGDKVGAGISALGDTVPLIRGKCSFVQLCERGQELANWLSEGERKLPRGLVYSLLLIARQVQKSLKDDPYYMYMPLLIYQLARNVKHEEIQEKLRQRFLMEAQEDLNTFVTEATIPVVYALMKTRQGREQ